MSYAIRVAPSALSGKVNIPPSKSMMHRAFICAALSKGRSAITPYYLSDDLRQTLEGIKAFGASYHQSEDAMHIQGPRVPILKQSTLYIDESATTLRLLMPLLAYLKCPVSIKLGNGLIKRPQTTYETLFPGLKRTEFGWHLNDSLHAGTYKLQKPISSQFISGLLIALPLLKASSTVTVDSLVSTPYINLTIDMLSKFGILIKVSDNTFFIRAPQTYQSTDIHIEGDYSQAAFFLCAGLLNLRIEVKNTQPSSIQGDSVIVKLLKSMGGKIILSEHSITSMRSSLKPLEYDIDQTPDLLPALAPLLAVTPGISLIKGFQRLQYKESNRIKAIVSSMNALGANFVLEDEVLKIYGVLKLKGGTTVHAHGDHRIAMMLTLAGSICEHPIIIENADAITKSYPTFYEDFMRLGGLITTLKHKFQD